MMQAAVVTDGTSDRVLIPVLRWMLSIVTPAPIDVRWADLRGLRSPPRSLEERISRAVELYPCQLLFVHRDAEAQPFRWREAEIQRANRTQVPHVCVVPVRMQEAWLLHDEAALRRAAGCPSGTEPLDLPALGAVESVRDPRQVLHTALTLASELRGRRLRKFRPNVAAHRLAELVEDWSPLRALPAFQRLEELARVALQTLGVPLYPPPGMN